MKYINNLFLCNFFGIPPGLYYSHHIAMHHSHNNTAPWDLSSTMPYQRDSKWHHCQYMLRFTFAIWFELPYILFRKKFYQMMLRCVLIEYRQIVRDEIETQLAEFIAIKAKTKSEMIELKESSTSY